MKKCKLLIFPFAILHLTITSCTPEPPDTVCIGADSKCPGFSWSFVHPDTYVNLMGRDDHLIHPDSIFILNMSLDTMRLVPMFNEFANWWSIDFAPGPYQELNCFNQCVLDSAFSRFYYLYVGNEDWDTVEVHFPAKTIYATFFEVYYNGIDATVPEDKPHELPTSTFWFQKRNN